MLRLLILLGGAGGLWSYFFRAPDGPQRRERAKEVLERLSGEARMIERHAAGSPLVSKIITGALAVRAARVGGLRGSLVALIVEKLAERRKQQVSPLRSAASTSRP